MNVLRSLLPAFLLVAAAAAPAADSATAKRLFAKPPREYATAPLWVWNDQLTDAQVRGTLRDLAGQGVRQAFVHPRPGLMTPYLSPEWFRLWRVALDEAKRLDMNIWIYDENSYPSGFAGGWVPELMPESRGRGLKLAEVKTAPKWDASLIAVLKLDGDAVEDVSARLKSGESLPAGRYVVATLLRAGNSPWHGNRSYVDLLYPGVTEKFIEVTHEAYKRELGNEFGKRIPGIFTDEPEITPAGGRPWTADLPEQFQQRWGYGLITNLPSLALEVGDWKRVRHNYFSTLSDLFIERWAKPYFNWCATNHLEFTGHYWDHNWPQCSGVPDNMAMAAWQQRPGIDILMNQYAEHTHAQFGNVRACREISSLANQFGRRTLVELYGAGGWDLRFEDMKRIGDWLQVLGVNTLDEHLSYVTIRGARKRDHPQSFSYHEPWWEAYHVSAERFARLSAALTQGEQINRILVIEPTTTAWMYQGNEAKLREIGDAFFNFLMQLEAAQIEYDLGCEDVMARFGKPAAEQIVVGGKDGKPLGKGLTIGRRTYHTVIFPPLMENLQSSTRDLLDATAVGRFLPRKMAVDGRWQETPPAQPGGPVPDGPWMAKLLEDIRQRSEADGFSIRRVPGDRGTLFHHRRQLADGQLLFLVNTSIEHASAGVVLSPARGVEQWHPATGAVEKFPFADLGKEVSAKFDLPPCGSLLLFLSNEKLEQALGAPGKPTSLAATGPVGIRRVEPNVLTLDYVDITAGGETRSNQYFYAANQFAWRKNGMDRNPWDSAVQFKDELIRKTFPPDSGFSATHRFTIEGAVPANLTIVIERPDLYTITCNGQPVSAKPGEWWLDKAFGKISIAAAARAGANAVTLTARPFTMYHELEPAYVLGDFALKAAPHGFVIAPDAPLALAPAPTPETRTHGINPDGTMWLSGGIGFTPGVDDRTPFVVFDLGRVTDLSAVRVWNYAEANVRDLTGRGTRRLRVSAGPRADALAPVGTDFTLARAQGEAAPETLRGPAPAVRFVRLDLLANHAGVQFPVAGEPPDNGFVGLAEVELLDAAGQPLKGVKIHQVSSELPSHQRVAKQLLDGSGLGGARPGWNAQGHPFYSAGVAYRQSFELAGLSGGYRVRLPEWYGSVARVDVNGRRAGYIVSAPWECDVTPLLKRGANSIEVVVIGTLKNTLGPHHGNHAPGSAWPSMFQHGPGDGPPPGRSYSTIGYGLFAPFLLEQTVSQ
jgi:hypothetical protein